MLTKIVLKDFKDAKGSDRIIRNLKRIMDIRILNLDCNQGTITFWHNTESILDRIKRDLSAIGFTIISTTALNDRKKSKTPNFF